MDVHQRDAGHARGRDPDAKPGEEGRAQERPPSRRHTLERPARGEWQYPAGRKPRDEPQHDPRRHAMREPHRQRRESDREQPPAQRRRQTHTHHGRRDGADERSEVIRGREPGPVGDREAGVRLHQRQDGREGEPANAHGDRESGHPRHGRHPRRQRPCGRRHSAHDARDRG